MLTAKAIEEKLCGLLTASLSASGVRGVTVQGAWRTAMSGLSRWIVDEDGDDVAFVSVALGNPAWRAYSLTEATLQANVTLYVRTEYDVDGIALASASEAIDGLLASLVENVDVDDNRLDAEDFSVDAFADNGSSTPSVNSGICSVTWNVTISGSRKEQQTTNN